MKNDLKFRNKTIKSNTPRKFANNSGQKIFLASSLKRKKMFENKSNSKNSIHDNNSSSVIESKKNNVKVLTPRYNEMIGISKRLFQNFNKHKNTRKHLYLNNEKSVIINDNCNDKSYNNLTEYNSIISLLDNIINKYNSYAYEILIKIKNYIKKLISEKNEINKYNNSYKSLIHINDKKISLLDKSNIRIINRSEINNNKDKNRNKEEEINQYKLENNNLFRKIRKLYQKINELEKRYKIEKLKYLFFIIEQEKKIAGLEQKIDVKKIPLDEAIIGKMKELKCYPNYYKPDINEDIIINNSFNKSKKHPLSSTIRNIKNNNSFLKSRNRNNDIKNKYSFDKEVYPSPKNNQSQVIANLKNNDKKMNNKSNSKSKSQRKAMKLEDISDDRNDIQKNNIYDYSNVNQCFCEKNFFISHPKLNYVKNSQEKNHFQKLKTKEQLNGISNISNLLSNINLNSKFQKNAINDFSYFINNSFVNIEKYRNYHNYMNMENKFEEDLKLKRKASL